MKLGVVLITGTTEGLSFVQASSFSTDSKVDEEMLAIALSNFCQSCDMSCHDNVLLKNIDLLSRVTRKDSMKPVLYCLISISELILQ